MKRFGGIAVVLSLLSVAAWAQPSARITTMHMVQGATTAEVTFHILCDGEVQYTLTKNQLTFTDNGLAVDDYTITESPSPAARKLFSTALVLDASGSMGGAPNAAVKTAASAFIQFMDGVADEAAVFWFNSVVTLKQSMTTSKSLLNTAVQALPASGATAVWDAAYEGVALVAANGQNPKRSVLLLTDGADNSSTKTPAQIISLAQLHNVRVFAVGLGSNINASSLQLIAALTGGQYFQTPDASALQSIFTQIANFMGRGFDEHTVAFKSPDPDATTHRLVASVVVCDTDVETEHTEQAIVVSVIGDNPSPVQPVSLQLGANAPNPLTTGSSTIIPYQVLGSSPLRVRLQVFDLLGRQVATLVDGEVSVGAHHATFSPDGLARGMYLYRLSSGNTTTSRVMLLQ